MSKKYPIDAEVAYTYIISNKRLTLIAALGVTLGIAVFIFMNLVQKELMVGNSVR